MLFAVRTTNALRNNGNPHTTSVQQNWLTIGQKEKRMGAENSPKSLLYLLLFDGNLLLLAGVEYYR